MYPDRNTVRGRRGGSLHFSRFDLLPDYVMEKNPHKLLPGYIRASYDEIAQVEALGQDMENLTPLLKRIEAEAGPEASKYVGDLVKIAIHDPDTLSKYQLARKFRSFNAATLLQIDSAITQFGDEVRNLVSIAATHGPRKIMQAPDIPSWWKGFVKSFTKEGRVFAEGSGLHYEDVMDIISGRGTGHGEAEELSRFGRGSRLAMTPFRILDFRAKRSQMLAGVEHAKSLFGKLKVDPAHIGAKARLQQLMGSDYSDGYDSLRFALRRGHLTGDDLVDIGFNHMRQLQPLSLLDIPPNWTGETGKTLTQFKTFSYHYLGSTIKRHVIDEARKGNYVPLGALLTSGLLVGEGIGDLRAFVKNQPIGERGGVSEDDGAAMAVSKRIVDNYLEIGGVGLLSDFFEAVMYRNWGGLGRFFGGPTLALVTEGTKEASDLVLKGDVKGAGKFLGERVPVVGRGVTRRIITRDQAEPARKRSKWSQFNRPTGRSKTSYIKQYLGEN
jgi:hypothetical protein